MATTVIGSLQITAACPVQGSLNGTDGTVSAGVGCAMRLKNVGSQTLWVALQSGGTATGPDTGWVVSDTRLLYPGQTWDVPAPPSGQAWTILAAPRRTINALMERFALIGGGVLALAGIGAYTLWRERFSLWRHLRRIV